MATEGSTIEVRVPPRLCDAQGMVHAGRYHDFLEDAFLAWLDDHRAAYDVLLAQDIDLVIGRTAIEYRAPARLGDRLHVTALAAGSSRSTLTIDFTVRRDDELLAAASTTYIAVRDGRSTALPAELRAALGTSP